MNNVVANNQSKVDTTTFSGEVLFRVRLTSDNIHLFLDAVKEGLIYDGSEADLVDRLGLLEQRIYERHSKGQDISRLEVEEDILQATLERMRRIND